MIKIETERSHYVFDEGGRYLRLPKTETGREWWEHSSGVLKDNVWHEVESVKVIENFEGDKVLNIMYPGASHGIVTTVIMPSSIENAERLAEMMKEDDDATLPGKRWA